jgi:hypothetical protein
MSWYGFVHNPVLPYAKGFVAVKLPNPLNQQLLVDKFRSFHSN